MEDEAIARLRRLNADKMRPEPEAAEIFKGTDFEKQGTELLRREAVPPNPFHTPPRTPQSNVDGDSVYTASNVAPSYLSQASDAFAVAGARQPCKIPPRKVLCKGRGS